MKMNKFLFFHAVSVQGKYNVLSDYNLSHGDIQNMFDSDDTEYPEIADRYFKMAKDDPVVLLEKEGELVPPFVLFPFCGPMDWEDNDKREEYVTIWSFWFCSLSNADKVRYCYKFQYPEFWLRLCEIHYEYKKFYKDRGNQITFEEIGYLIPEAVKEEHFLN